METIGTVRGIWRYPVKSMQGERLERCEVGLQGLPGDRGWALRDEKAGEIRGAKKLPKLMLCRARYLEEPGDEHIPAVEIGLPDGETFTSGDASANERLSAFLGRPVTLWPRQPPSDAEHYRRRRRTDEQALREMLSREPGEPLPDLSSIPADLLQELLEYVAPPGTYFDVTPLHLLTSASLSRLAALHPGSVLGERRFRPNLVIETPADAEGFVEIGWCGRTVAIGSARIACQYPTPRCGMTTHEQPGLPRDPSILRAIVREADQNVGVYATALAAGPVALGDSVALLEP